MISPVVTWRDTKKLKNYLNKKGKILVWTKIYVAPEVFEHQTPYFAGIVEFGDGEKRSLEIVDCNEEDLKEGLEVVTVVRKIGKVEKDEVVEYGIKVRPVLLQNAV